LRFEKRKKKMETTNNKQTNGNGDSVHFRIDLYLVNFVVCFFRVGSCGAYRADPRASADIINIVLTSTYSRRYVLRAKKMKIVFLHR